MKQNRRDFLKMNAGLFAFSPVDFLAKFLCPLNPSCNNRDGLRNYVLLNMAGAPPRWAFDNPLRPLERLKMKANPMIVTRFKEGEFRSSEDIEFEFKLESVGKYNMPPLWNLPVDKNVSAGGNISQLLDNSMMIRGVRMGIDGHSLNQRKIVAPNPSGPSITGLLADKSGAHLPMVGMSGFEYPAQTTQLAAYRSAEGNPIILINNHSPDYYNELFENFIQEKGDSGKNTDELLDVLLKQKELMGGDLYKNRSRARKLLSLNLKKLKEQYLVRLDKYNKIISSGKLNRNLKGITDKRIPGIEKSRLKEGSNQDNIHLFFLEKFFIADNDFRDSLTEMDLFGLAQQFALIEFLLINNLSNTMAIDLSAPSYLGLKKGYRSTHYDEKTKRISSKASLESISSYTDRFYSFDAHDAGLIPHHLFTSVFYFIFSNCLVELTNALKNKGENLFEETLIHVTAEFEREPRPDMLGSEHGYNGQNNTFISGAIDEFKIIGNIYQSNLWKTKATFFDIGTWGEGAPLKSFDNRPLVYGNIASSIAQVMGIQSPTPKDPTVLNLKGGKIKSMFDELENVSQG